jgi:hypothetical protein
VTSFEAPAIAAGKPNPKIAHSSQQSRRTPFAMIPLARALASTAAFR